MTLRKFVTLARDQAYYLWGKYLDIYENSNGTDELAKEQLDKYRELYLQLMIDIEAIENSPMSL